MKRFAAILVVAAAFTGGAPMVAEARPLDTCGGDTWPLSLKLIPYC